MPIWHASPVPSAMITCNPPTVPSAGGEALGSFLSIQVGAALHPYIVSDTLSSLSSLSLSPLLSPFSPPLGPGAIELQARTRPLLSEDELIALRAEVAKAQALSLTSIKSSKHRSSGSKGSWWGVLGGGSDAGDDGETTNLEMDVVHERGGDTRFVVEADEFISGRPKDAARGLNFYLKANDMVCALVTACPVTSHSSCSYIPHSALTAPSSLPQDIYEKMMHGVTSVRREILEHGTEDDKECLEYILNEPAGSSAKVFANGTVAQPLPRLCMSRVPF